MGNRFDIKSYWGNRNNFLEFWRPLDDHNDAEEKPLEESAIYALLNSNEPNHVQHLSFNYLAYLPVKSNNLSVKKKWKSTSTSLEIMQDESFLLVPVFIIMNH